MMAKATLAVLVAASPLQPSVEREVEVPAAGRVAVVLDRDVYDTARPDLGDLRVVDESGSQVPHLLERGPADQAPERATARFLNRTFVRGRTETVSLDFGGSVWKSDVTLSMSGDNFRRRVVVEASDDNASWESLTDDAYVFAVPGPTPTRYERVALPENDARFLRVAVRHGEGDPPRVEIREAWSLTTRRRAPQVMPLTTRLVRHEDADRHETLLVLDLGARSQPFQRIDVDVAEPRFWRGVAIEARRDPPPPRPGRPLAPISWVPLGEACLYRYEEAGRRSEALSLQASGRERTIRLRIRNRDDRPLEVRGVTVYAPVERIVFEAAPGRRFRLTYGVPDRTPPNYDLARTVGDDPSWAAAATVVRLGAATRHRATPGALPWTERHPALLWTGLVVAVAILGALTWRAVRAGG
jgi:uncharacterized protein DUF3999